MDTAKKGFFDSFLGTLKTENNINLVLDTASLLRAGGTAIISGIVIGLAVRWLGKMLNI